MTCLYHRNLDVLHLGEVAQRVAVGQQKVGVHLVLDALDHVHDVVDHVLAAEQVQELRQSAHRLRLQVLELVRQFALQTLTQQRHRDVARLRHQKGGVVSFLQEAF